MKLSNLDPAVRREALLLFVFSVLCFSLWLARAMWTGSPGYIFLNWNLFLAMIPWLISSGMKTTRYAAWSWVVALPAWLLFFPNAPYILTDLFHLRRHPGMWFDLVLILSFAWTGLLFGLLSLKHIEEVLVQRLGNTRALVISAVFLFMCAFGIYLGRYERWNSWDMLHQPLSLLADIADRFIHPQNHPRTWGMTLLFGLMLNMMYFSFRYMRAAGQPGEQR
jgi:uncharacterized membrane protein